MENTTAVKLTETIAEGDKSIIVDRVFASGRKERWVFAAWDTVGTNGLRVGEPRPHHFPKYLWEDICYRRETWPERHPVADPDGKWQWVRNKSGHWVIWGAPVCPY